MATSNGSERVENLVNTLRQWQAIERESISTTKEIIEQTKSPLVRLMMEIISHDSLMHHRVQQFLIDGVTESNVTVTRDDLAQVWEKIEEHDKVERKTIELAKQLMKESWSPVHKRLLDYLITDEQKHDALIGQLEDLKKDMTRASGA